MGKYRPVTTGNSPAAYLTCQWQKRLDPSYGTYGSGPALYTYVARLSASNGGDSVAAIATRGDIKRPLITVAAQ